MLVFDFVNTFIFRHIIFLMILTLPVLVAAQSAHPILSVFMGRVVDDAVRLNWTVTGGNTCEGIRIQRSDDGQFFTYIGRIEGVCGSPDADIPYVFMDEDPLPYQEAWYRLELGTQGYSAPVAVRYIPLNAGGYNLRIDPPAGVAYVDFSNPTHETLSFELYSLNGKRLFSGTSTQSELVISLRTYPSQLLLLRMSFAERQMVIRIPNF